MKKILLIDNYDSFTYNLFQLLNENAKDTEIKVLRNDCFTLDQIDEYDGLIISPGPGLPEDAGLIVPIIQEFGKVKPILGVCLGHQAIGVAYGGTLINIPKVCHGISTKIQTRYNTTLFDNLPSSFQVGRYHSWVVNEDTLPSCLRITARDDNDMVMAMEHKEYKVTGVQFHPESVLTEYGKEMICNWINS